MTMFKTLFSAAALAAVTAAAPMSAQAAVFTSYIDLTGFGEFDARGGISLADVEFLGTEANLDFSQSGSIDGAIAGDFPSDDFTLATSVFAFGGALDLPGIDEDAVWTVSIEGFISGTYREVGEMFPEMFNINFDETIDSISAGLGTFSLNDAVDFLGGPAFPDTDALTATVIALLGANEYNLLFDDTTALILSDEIADLPAAVILSDDDNPLEEANAFLSDFGLGLPLPDLIQATGFFDARITLTAETRDPVDVIEPASLSLLGLGLAGLGIAWRRRQG